MPKRGRFKGKMRARIEQYPAINSNPVLSIIKDSTVLYSNKIGEPSVQ
ncbi:MAG: hypothetical protein QG646_1473 [Euryarchaeota archaeon]|nr:hypothetical protein [Euryarchaeota archaeon]